MFSPIIIESFIFTIFLWIWFYGSPQQSWYWMTTGVIFGSLMDFFVLRMKNRKVSKIVDLIRTLTGLGAIYFRWVYPDIILGFTAGFMLPPFIITLLLWIRLGRWISWADIRELHGWPPDKSIG